jgi:hypothetical protein
MIAPRVTRSLSTGLALGLALIMNPSVFAQPLSSGSGAGTGTGMMGGARNTTGTGQETGNPTGTGNETGTGSVNSLRTGPSLNLYRAGPDPRDAGDVRRLRRNLNPGQVVPFGPGVGTSFPDDLTLFPTVVSSSPSDGSGATDLSKVQPKMLEEARRIASPGDRSLTLQRIAAAAIFSNQLPLAHTALTEATEAALLEPVPLVRDQRLIAIVTTLNYLAEAHLREGKVEYSVSDKNEPSTETPRTDRTTLIRRAQIEWERAGIVARRISNPTFRSEILFRVVDNQSYGSQTIVSEFPAPTDSRGRSSESGALFDGLPDRILEDAARVALLIERPVWRDRGLVAITQAAAASRQFPRALSVARLIPQPEVRTDALLHLAEAQARRDDPAGATFTYREAALAVASIPLDDPRSVLAGVLIDSLISVGRFEDARRSIALYSDGANRLIALGAVAESQGLRGRADQANAWIAREVPPAQRPELYRRVIQGTLKAIEQNRSHELSNRDR